MPKDKHRVKSFGSSHEEEEDIPKSVNIRKADEGGYIARKQGGDLGFEGIEIVSSDLKKLLKQCGEFLA